MANQSERQNSSAFPETGEPVNPAPAKVNPGSGTDTAGELINALDNLLLERAVREHREALARVNTLKMALRDDEDSSPEGRG